VAKTRFYESRLSAFILRRIEFLCRMNMLTPVRKNKSTEWENKWVSMTCNKFEIEVYKEVDRKVKIRCTDFDLLSGRF